MRVRRERHPYQTDANGLMLLGNRYYDPAIGRFISQDRARSGRNWYAYCGNNPLVAVDPSGLFPQPNLGAKDAQSLLDSLNARADTFLDALRGVPQEALGAAEAFAAFMNSYFETGGALSVGVGNTEITTPFSWWVNVNLVVQPGASWWDPSTWDTTLNGNIGGGLGIGEGTNTGFNFGADPHFQAAQTWTASLDPNWTAGGFWADVLGGGASVTTPDLTWPPELSYGGGRVCAGSGGGVFAGPQWDASVSLRYLFGKF